MKEVRNRFKEAFEVNLGENFQKYNTLRRCGEDNARAHFNKLAHLREKLSLERSTSGDKHAAVLIGSLPSCYASIP